MVKLLILRYFYAIWLFELPAVNNINMCAITPFFINSLARFIRNFLKIVIDFRESHLSPLLEIGNSFIKSYHALLLGPLDFTEWLLVIVLVHQSEETGRGALDCGGTGFVVKEGLLSKRAARLDLTHGYKILVGDKIYQLLS